MLMRRFNRCTCCLISTVLLLAVTGCPKEEESKSATPPDDAKSTEPTKSEADSTAEVEARLAKADLLDGTADKIVTRCASCALGMDGTAEHALKVLDYTLHFCTPGCAQRFGENLTESVLAMKIPEG